MVSGALTQSCRRFPPVETRHRRDYDDTAAVASFRCTVERPPRKLAAGFAPSSRTIEEELRTAFGRGRYEHPENVVGHRDFRRRDGSRATGTARARGWRTAEWRSQALRPYQQPTKRAEALLAGDHLAGTNTRRIALHADTADRAVVCPFRALSL